MPIHLPALSAIIDYSRSIPPIYRAIMMAFRGVDSERKYCEAVLESSLRNYVKNARGDIALTSYVTDMELTEAIRQLIDPYRSKSVKKKLKAELNPKVQLRPHGGVRDR